MPDFSMKQKRKGILLTVNKSLGLICEEVVCVSCVICSFVVDRELVSFLKLKFSGSLDQQMGLVVHGCPTPRNRACTNTHFH